LLPSTQL
jgi:hypothetical protein